MPMPECPFPPSSLAPNQHEIPMLYDWCQKHCDDGWRVLELGGGVTTWAIFRGITTHAYFEEYPIYTCVEDYPSCVAAVSEHLPHVHLQADWDYGDKVFDLVFLDSSAGNPWSKNGIYRKEAMIAAEPHMNPGCYCLIHDHRRCKRYKYLMNHVSEDSRYSFIEEIRPRYSFGLGIYRFKGG